MLGRFISADTLVPEPGNPQSLNRYAYVTNNPLRYVDDDGHLPIVPLLIVGGAIALKVIDYSWTAWDSYQSLRVLNDPNADQAAKAQAAANLALTAAFEAAEPDDLLPIALPLDDLARLGVIVGVKKVGREAGEKATGQMHHLLSEKIARALAEHKTLKGVFDRKDARLVFQAKDKAAHWGYQTWHRELDDEVVKWLSDPKRAEATPEEFLKFLQELYQRPDIKARIPGVDLTDLIQEVKP